MEDRNSEQTIDVRFCPVCGLELAGANAVCACDGSVLMPFASDPLIGKTLAGYKILDVIGRGGMGIVYKAKDQLMDRIVAIKMLHAHLLGDEHSKQRFQQEARAASCIGHPNVITAFDFGLADSRQPYLVMDFLQGKSLSDVIEAEGPLSPERAVTVFIQACDALATAHEKGVLHRDLKPSNIMLVETREERDFVKIVDFGIAKLLPHSGKEFQQLTQTGEVFGSPLYMSPEQFLGGKLDERTDIYAMGCVMYEALTGKPPIMGEHVLETMYKHLNEMPQRFSATSPDRKISEKIEAIIFRALEKEPDMRYQSMSALRDDLQLTRKGFKDRRPLKVKLQAFLHTLKRAQRKHADMASTVLISVLLVFIGIAVYWSWTLSARSGQDSQWKQLKQEGQEAYRLEDLGTAFQKFSLAAKVAKDNFGEEDPRYTDTLKRLAWVLESRGKYADARRIYAEINKLTPEDVAKVKLAQIAYAGLSAGWTETLGKTGVEAGLKRAALTIDKYFGPTDPGLVPLLEKRGELFKEQRQFADAENEYMRIISIMTETEGAASVGTARATADIADLYAVWDNKEAAIKNYQKAIALYQQLLGQRAPQIAEVKQKLDDVVKGHVKPVQAEKRPSELEIPELIPGSN